MTNIVQPSISIQKKKKKKNSRNNVDLDKINFDDEKKI